MPPRNSARGAGIAGPAVPRPPDLPAPPAAPPGAQAEHAGAGRQRGQPRHHRPQHAAAKPAMRPGRTDRSAPGASGRPFPAGIRTAPTVPAPSPARRRRSACSPLRPGRRASSSKPIALFTSVAMRSSSCGERGWRRCLPSAPDGVRIVHHHRQADAVDLRLLVDQRADGLADFVVRRLLAGGPAASRRRTGPGVGVRQVVLHRDGVVRFGGLAGRVRPSACCASPGRRDRSVSCVSLIRSKFIRTDGLRAHLAGAEAVLSSISSTARAMRSSVAWRSSSVDSAMARRSTGSPARASRSPRESIDRDVLRPQPGHGGGDQVQDGLHALAVQPGRAAIVSITPACASCSSRAKGSRCGSTRCTRTRAHAVDGADGAGQLALQRAGFVDALLEVGGGEAVAAVEDFVADGAAGGQPLLSPASGAFPAPARPAPGSGCRSARGDRARDGVTAGPPSGRRRGCRDRCTATPSDRCCRAASSARACRACRWLRRRARRYARGRAPSDPRAGPSSDAPLCQVGSVHEHDFASLPGVLPWRRTCARWLTWGLTGRQILPGEVGF